MEDEIKDRKNTMFYTTHKNIKTIQLQQLKRYSKEKRIESKK